MMYSIPIHPTPGIGYCFVVDAENPQHALSVLSYEIRQCLKAGVDKEDDSQGNHLVEVLKILRKPWRTAYKSSMNWRVNKVEVVQVKAMKISYDNPLIPWYWNNDAKEKGKASLSMTSNHHELKIQILPRRKPYKQQRNQGHSDV